MYAESEGGGIGFRWLTRRTNTAALSLSLSDVFDQASNKYPEALFSFSLYILNQFPVTAYLPLSRRKTAASFFGTNLDNSLPPLYAIGWPAATAVLLGWP